MSIIILLLNLFFILLIFYQIFLTRNIFKKKIIEGLDLRNPNYNSDLDFNAVIALYTNGNNDIANTNRVSPNSSNISSNMATNASPINATSSPIIDTLPIITPTTDYLTFPTNSSIAGSIFVPISPIVPAPVPGDDNTIYNIIVQMINDNNKIISSITKVDLPTFVPDPSNSITPCSVGLDINKPYNKSPYTFTDPQLFLLNFTVYAINNNNQQITRAINNPDIIIPRNSFKTVFTDSIPKSVLDFNKMTDDNKKYMQSLQVKMIQLINENNAYFISQPLNITMKPFSPK